MPPTDAELRDWWPTTQSLDLVCGSIDTVANAVAMEFRRFARGGSVTGEWAKRAGPYEVFASAPHFANVVTFIAVMPTTSKWVVVWSNNFLCQGYDSLCWSLTHHHGLTSVNWAAHDEQTTFQPGSRFTYRAKSDNVVAERSVACVREDRKWIFVEAGEPIPEEDTAGYLARTKSERLNERRVTELLARLGARPWDHSFYSLQENPAFLLSRDAPPFAIVRSRGDVTALQRR